MLGKGRSDAAYLRDGDEAAARVPAQDAKPRIANFRLVDYLDTPKYPKEIRVARARSAGMVHLICFHKPTHVYTTPTHSK